MPTILIKNDYAGPHFSKSQSKLENLGIFANMGTDEIIGNGLIYFVTFTASNNNSNRKREGPFLDSPFEPLTLLWICPGLAHL